jgi:hypothetical protein
MRKKQLPTFEKMNKQEGSLTRSQFKMEKNKNRPKFTKTETMEEFLARGGAVTKGEKPKYEQPKDSRFKFKERTSAYRGNVAIVRNKTFNEDKAFQSGMSKSKLIAQNLEKRVKRKKEE